MQQTRPPFKYPKWMIACTILYVAGVLTLLVGQLFLKWTINTETIILYLIAWIPAVLPLIHRLSIGGVDVQLSEKVAQIEEKVQEMQPVIATALNDSEIEKEKEQGLGGLKVDPSSIKVRYSAKRDGEGYQVKVWLDTPADFGNTQVEKVTYDRRDIAELSGIRHILRPPNFVHAFQYSRPFTIRAEIKLKNGNVLRRRKYISVDQDDADTGESAEPAGPDGDSQ